MTFMSQYAAALAHNLTQIAGGDLNVAFFTNCGSVANEAALKLAERAQGEKRRTVAYASNSFHGKTRAALSVTDSEFYQGGFQLLPNRRRVPFGDLNALEDAFRSDRSIGIFIVETVQGGAGIVLPPPGYIKGVRALCDKYEVLWIAYEVQCGMGRTGRFFAFEHYGVRLDILALAKSLGGGKTAIGAYITRRDIHKRAYGTPKTALIHGPAHLQRHGRRVCHVHRDAARPLRRGPHRQQRERRRIPPRAAAGLEANHVSTWTSSSRASSRSWNGASRG
jgi:ornithine--oxo-acid transaminase